MATMAQTPTPSPLVTLEQEVLTNLHNKLHTIILAHIGVIVLFLALIGVGGWFGLRSYDKQVARVETLQQQFEKSQEISAQAQKQLADIIAADSAARTQETAQQQQIETQILQRASQAPAPIVKQALQPSANAASVVLGLRDEFSSFKPPADPTVEPDGKLAVSVSTAQQLIGIGEQEKLFSANYQSEVQLFTLEQSKSTSLSKDLAQCQDVETKDKVTLANAQKTIAAYNKLVNRSKFRKILGSIGRNAERVGILVVGFEIGHAL